MGDVHATIALSNPRRPELDPLPVSARADSGALMLCIPAALAAALQVQQESIREVSVADGRMLQVPYVGLQSPHAACSGLRGLRGVGEEAGLQTSSSHKKAVPADRPVCEVVKGRPGSGGTHTHVSAVKEETDHEEHGHAAGGGHQPEG